MNQKICAKLRIPHSNTQTHYTIPAYDRSLIEIEFLNQPITFKLNRSGRFEFESNLEASQVPTKNAP